jgi:hypothetical protein
VKVPEGKKYLRSLECSSKYNINNHVIVTDCEANIFDLGENLVVSSCDCGNGHSSFMIVGTY